MTMFIYVDITCSFQVKSHPCWKTGNAPKHIAQNPHIVICADAHSHTSEMSNGSLKNLVNNEKAGGKALPRQEASAGCNKSAEVLCGIHFNYSLEIKTKLEISCVIRKWST